MMGKKKLSTIRAEVREALAAGGQDAAWFDEQIRKLEEGPRKDTREKETLLLLKKALEDASRKSSRHARGGTTHSRP